MAAAVAAGGFVGTLLRYGLGVAWPDNGGFPWTTLGINVAGSLALGVLTGFWALSGAAPAWVRAALGPGLLGAFTTYSAVAVHLTSATGASAAGTPDAVQWWGYLAASLLAGLAAAAAGLWAGGGLARRRPSRRGRARRGGDTA
ncbi:fluoride efflux transporter FluC [Arthrobacter sp.]|uniref:fluoride efflux transporter FluC n=1 Tax=Arthrobacter sp. TaxID=1667 RepID=UPI00367343A5